MISNVLLARRLSAAEAGRLWGQLGFASSLMFGKFGRARLAPLVRREFEWRANLNPQLEACLRWWLRVLQSHAPRVVPVGLRHRGVVISYSDGEGGGGGVGVAVFHYSFPPVAAFLKVPREVRLLWSSARSEALPTEEISDIYSIEALGPAVILAEFEHLVRGELWIHFIDNVGTQMTLIKGSASVRSEDVIIGYTWERVVSARSFLWVERVASGDNPVDGLSRGVLEGPWGDVRLTSVPPALLRRLRERAFPKT